MISHTHQQKTKHGHVHAKMQLQHPSLTDLFRLLRVPSAYFQKESRNIRAFSQNKQELKDMSKKEHQWIISNSREESLTKRQNNVYVGPGSYNVSCKSHSPKISIAKSSRFIYRDKANALIGPAYYNCPSTSFATKRKYILPKKEREKVIKTQNNVDYNVDVEKYFSLLTDLQEPGQKDNVKSKKLGSSVFASKLPRLSNDVIGSSLGPGDYQIPSPMQHKKKHQKKMQIRRNVSKRQVSESGISDDRGVGPGSYNIDGYELKVAKGCGFPKEIRFNDKRPKKIQSSLTLGPRHYMQKKYIHRNKDALKKQNKFEWITSSSKDINSPNISARTKTNQKGALK